MTYNEIKTKIKNFIIENCDNVSTKYTTMDACFKQGYQITGYYNNYPQGTGIADSSTKKYKVIILTPIQQISADAIENDINYYINSVLNITDLNATIKTQIEKILFFNDMINFCCNTMCFVLSKYTSNKYLIYKSNISFQAINIGKDYASYNFLLNEIIKNQDVNAILLTVFNNIRNSLKTQAIKYNYINSGT